MITTPDDRRAQGLHRQRRRARRARGGLRPARDRRRVARACTRSSYRSGTRRASRSTGVRIEDDGRKIGLNGVDNGRLWFDGVRVPRDATCSTGTPTSPRTAATSPTIENPDRRFFTMLGTLVQGRVCVGGAGINASKVALADRDQVRLPAPSVRATRAPTRRSCSSTTACTSAGCSRCWRSTYALHFAQEARSPSCTRCSPTTDAPTSTPRRALESRAAGTKALGTWHAHAGPSRSAARRAAAPATWSANRFDALRADTDVFTTFEGDNHVLLQLVAKGLLTDYSRASRTSTSSAWSGSSPASRSRP